MSKEITSKTKIRLEHIRDLIAVDTKRKHILSEILPKYGIKEAQGDVLIRKARELLIKEHEENRPKTRALSIEGHLKHISDIKDLPPEDITQADRQRLIHSIKVHIDKLQGNKLPEEIKTISHSTKEIKVTFQRVQAPNTIIINKPPAKQVK